MSGEATTIVAFCIVACGIGCLYLLVRWHAGKYAYQCPECKERFKISTATDFSSPHVPGMEGGKKYLKCPHCSKRVWAREVKTP